MKNIVKVCCRSVSQNCGSTAIYVFAANVVLAGGRGERRLRADDHELAITEDPEHGQLLLGAATRPASRKPDVVRRSSRSSASSPRRSLQSEVGGQPARLDIIPRPRYVVLPLLLFFCDNDIDFSRHAMRSSRKFAASPVLNRPYTHGIKLTELSAKLICNYAELNGIGLN